MFLQGMTEQVVILSLILLKCIGNHDSCLELPTDTCPVNMYLNEKGMISAEKEIIFHFILDCNLSNCYDTKRKFTKIDSRIIGRYFKTKKIHLLVSARAKKNM